MIQSIARGAEDIKEMERRNALLEQLYQADGRMDSLHPRHGVYTGLIQQQNNAN